MFATMNTGRKRKRKGRSEEEMDVMKRGREEKRGKRKGKERRRDVIYALRSCFHLHCVWKEEVGRRESIYCFISAFSYRFLHYFIDVSC